MKKKALKTFLLIMLTAIMIWVASPLIFDWAGLPSHLRLARGDEEMLELNIPLTVNIRGNRKGIIGINNRVLDGGGLTADLKEPLELKPRKLGRVELDFRLFGFLPVRRVRVSVLPRIHVIPGGHAIGVMIDINGVVIRGVTEVTGTEGEVATPARDSGLRVGDVIEGINGERVRGTEHAAELVERFAASRGRLVLRVNRPSFGVFYRIVTPKECGETGRQRLGIWIDEKKSGVGTMTYFHPGTGQFAALGHSVKEQVGSRGERRIVESDIVDIIRAEEGTPGEKIGAVAGGGSELGEIEENTRLGIFGAVKKEITNPLYPEPIPVALPQEVSTGEAEVLTVIDGNRIESFRVDIERVKDRSRPGQKGLVLRITDPDLLERTGGIVQGMSGSPIIQDGRLVGAVTHVFVDDSTRGYGVLAEWMVMESGLAERMRNGAHTGTAGRSLVA